MPVLEQLLGDPDRSASRSMIRNALEQAAGAEVPGELVWHDWLCTALQHQGLRCRAIDCTIDQAVEMAADGAQIITQYDDNSWLAIAQTTRNRNLVLQANGYSQSSWMTNRQLRTTLNSTQAAGSIRCVVVESRLTASASTAETNLKPMRRLWALLKPEWPDIWIVIVFALIIGLLTLATPVAVETLVNTVAFGKFLQPLVILSLMLLAFLAFSAALRALQTFVVELIQRRLFARVAADIAYRLPRVQSEAMEGLYGRELVNRFFDVVIVQKVAAQLLLDGVAIVLGTLIGMAMLAFYHPWLLGYDLMLLLMIALIVFVLGRGAVKSSIKESKTKYHMAAWLQDVAGCPTAFRCKGSARFVLERTDHLTFDYLTTRAAHFRILMRQILFALGMQAVASTVLLGLGGWLVISGQLTLGQLVAAELIVAVIVGSFAKFGKHMESFYDVLASVDKLGVLFDLPLESQHGLSGLPAEGGDEVELEDIGYRDASGQQILNGFNLTVRPSDRIALTGHAASGKSTLLDLLFGLRTPTRGHINLMGVQLRELDPDALRRHVALVREIEVFDGSVADNMRVGRPQVSEADVRNALADVGLLDDILGLPKQLETRLTGAGHPLSSTQLRRLMLARGCAGTPNLLLIDSTLDMLPDDEAMALLTWLCDADRPWALVLVTGREALAAVCNRRVEMHRQSELPGGTASNDLSPPPTEETVHG